MTILRLAAFLLVAALAPARVAQPSSAAAILLPPRLAVGQPATLAVLDGEGKLLAGAEVEFPTPGDESGRSVRVTTDATGRARFTAPAQTGVLIARLSGSGLRASGLVLEAPPPTSPDPVVQAVAPLLTLGDRFTVIGSGFSADADTNRVTLGGQPALVLAASPLALVVLPHPHTGLGPVELTVEVGGRRSAPVGVTLVALEIASGKTNLQRGERGVVEVRVHGTGQPVELEARNLTPDTIVLTGGDLQRLRTSGGENNRARIALSGRSGGEFALSVRLIPPAVGQPNPEALRQALLHAYRIAPPRWAVRTSRMLAWLREDPQNPARLREEIERILAEQPPEEFARRLEAAWKILLGG
ncbi:MAG: IPT/TIG domain-containing protein [Firmicutes bacterium]|nr:IPT/TIG domain-containing protein [Bacillota bacterium]